MELRFAASQKQKRWAHLPEDFLCSMFLRLNTRIRNYLVPNGQCLILETACRNRVNRKPVNLRVVYVYFQNIISLHGRPQGWVGLRIPYKLDLGAVRLMYRKAVLGNLVQWLKIFLQNWQLLVLRTRVAIGNKLQSLGAKISHPQLTFPSFAY